MLFLIGLNWPAFHSLYKKSQGKSEKPQEESSFLACQYTQSRAAGVAKAEISEQVKVPSAMPQTLPHILKPNTKPANCHKEIAKETSGLIAVAEGGEGKHSPAFLKPRCGKQKALAWETPVPWVLCLPSWFFTKHFREGGKGNLIYIFCIKLVWRFVFVWNKEPICLAPNTAAALSNLSLSCSGPFGQEANIQLIPCAG